MVAKVETTLGGRRFAIESGRLAKQASGSALVTYGETVVLCAVVEGDPETGADIEDYLPLTVDYREKTAAAGKFPGGFIKREGRPSQKEILSARLIDRPIRPLFPKEYCNELQVQAIVLSADQENDPDVLAQNAASAALCMSGIPFQGPIGSVRVGRIDGQFVLNPTWQQLPKSEMEMVVSGSADGVLMVEGAIKELPEDVVVAAIQFGHDHIKTIVQMQKDLMAQGAKPLRPVAEKVFDPALLKLMESRYYQQIRSLIQIPGKAERYKGLEDLRIAILTEHVKPGLPEAEANSITKQLKEIFNKVAKRATRDLIFEGVRSDGRPADAIRPIWCAVSELPRTHGSAVFTRGETQALVTVTLGTTSDQQVVDGLQDEYKKRFMLHYNFPSFSVNECKPNRGPGRREIGHGMLAERALEPVLPPADKFPYTIRVISDILESNGSSSMASVCGGTLAMYDAGVPLQAPVAGIAMGLVKEGERVQILSDILGSEDHEGDMDFKVCGTAKGVTAVQMDIKIGGVSADLMRRALEQARRGRVHILGEMAKCMTAARKDISPHAPRIEKIVIDKEKIGAVIGPGGKVIRKIEEETGATVEIEDDGTVLIASKNLAALTRAREWIEGITSEVKLGTVYNGEVVAARDFGAFVKLHPTGQEGMVHISELAEGYIKAVSDAVKIGDKIRVKVINIDDTGRIRLSRKQVILEEKGITPGAPGGAPAGGPGGAPRPVGPPRERAPMPMGGGDRGPRRDGPGGPPRPHGDGGGRGPGGGPPPRRHEEAPGRGPVGGTPPSAPAERAGGPPAAPATPAPPHDSHASEPGHRPADPDAAPRQP